MNIIDSPLIQTLILLGFGFSLGVMATFYYIYRTVRNTSLKALLLLADKIKTKDITFDEIWDMVCKTVDKMVEAKKNEESKNKLSEQIQGNSNNHC